MPLAKEMVAASSGDIRFDVPLYTVAEAARAIGVSAATLGSWVKRPASVRQQGEHPPVVTSVPSNSVRQPTIPFVGLAEGLVLAAVRRAGVPLQRIRPALERLSHDLGIDHALASRQLYTDGAEILFDYAEHSPGEAVMVRHLVVVRNQQRVFSEVVDQYLQRIDYAEDGYARLLRLPVYSVAQVVADPERAFGKPIFARGAAKVSDVLDRFWAGEDLNSVADDFGIPRADLEDVVRVASRRAA
ncbi:MAG TPA: DUF433 domain-containing protein [Acidimicrobiales bacterium]|nr:DUF433 domain-containing protein [Acidimicrobiales bacterium]